MHVDGWKVYLCLCSRFTIRLSCGIAEGFDNFLIEFGFVLVFVCKVFGVVVGPGYVVMSFCFLMKELAVVAYSGCFLFVRRDGSNR